MKIPKRVRTWIVFGVLLAFLGGGGLLLRNFVVGRIRAAVEQSLRYDRLRISAFPPSVVLENVRTVAGAPVLTAARVEARVSPLSLLRAPLELTVIVDRPVLRLEGPTAGGRPGRLDLRLPPWLRRAFVSDGEIHYASAGTEAALTGVRAFLRRRPEKIEAGFEAEAGSLSAPFLEAPVRGRIRASLETAGNDVAIRRLIVEGPDLLVDARGTLSNPSDPSLALAGTIRLPARLAAGALKLPFTWGGKIEGRGRLALEKGGLTVGARLESRDFVLNGEPLGPVTGDLTLGPGPKGKVALQVRPPGRPAGSLDIGFGGGFVRGTAAGLGPDPILREIKIPWPVRSLAWGTFELRDRVLTVEAELRDDFLGPSPPGRHPFRGPVHVRWDGRKSVTFSSERLESPFAVLAAEGRLEIGREISIVLRGDIRDVARGREFAGLVLGRSLDFPPIRGGGRAEIRIVGEYASPSIKFDFALAPAGFAGFDVLSAGGIVEIAKGEISGDVRAEDPNLNGRVTFAIKESKVEARLKADEAGLEKVFAGLGIKVPLSGRAQGDLVLTAAGRALRLSGDVSARRVLAFGQPLSDVRGRLEWSGGEAGSGELAFPSLEAKVFGGTIRGSGRFDFGARMFDLDLSTEGLDLGGFGPSFHGLAAVRLKGAGKFGEAGASGPFEVHGFRYATALAADMTGRAEVTFPPGGIKAALSGSILPGPNAFEGTLEYPAPDGRLRFAIRGSLSNLDLLVPWPGARGELRYDLEILGGRGPLTFGGTLDFLGPVFPFPRFAHALLDYSGLALIRDNRISIRSLRGKLGGGEVSGTGELRFGPGGLDSADVRVEGKAMTLSLFERTRALADAILRLSKDEGRFLLSGDVTVRRLLWRREINEGFAFSSSPYLEEPGSSRALDDLGLNIRLRADDNAILENSLGRLRGRFDLTLGGTIGAPVVLGELEVLQGTVEFQDRTFRVLRGNLSFFNPAAIEPYLDFRGETYLKDYRVTFSLRGPLNKLKPEFSSSPPLPPEDVLALLALGESFKRTYSYETSSRLSTGSLLSFQLAEEAKKRAERLFSLDRFRIDPFVLGSSTEMTARLTVGKKLSRNIVLLYSTNLASQREEIVRLEWEWSESFSLIGMRDELGRFSLDAKIRKRF